MRKPLPKRKPHFKLFNSIRNHRKTIGVYASNDMLAAYARIGMMATERWAQKTNDSFLADKADLLALAGRQRLDYALIVLSKLEAISPLTLTYEGDSYRLSLPNYAERQGFKKRNGGQTETYANANSNANKEQDPPTPASGGSSEVTEVPNKRPKKRSRERAEELAKEVWPELVEHAANYGRRWSPVMHSEQFKKLVARIEEGATRIDLHNAIDGFAALMEPNKRRDDERDMMKYCRATTLYQPTKFPEYLEAYAAEGAKDRANDWLAKGVAQSMEAQRKLETEGDE